MNNFGYIYKTTNMITGHIYIGKKIGSFNSSYWGSGIHLKRAIKKFGRYVFKVELIAFTKDKDELNNFEKYFIEKYRKELGKDELYNIANGGDGGNVWPNGSPTIEQRRKIGLHSLGNTTHKINCFCYFCKAHRYGRKGKLNSMFGRHYHHTEETKEKIKKTKAKYPYRHSIERREKIRKIMLGSKRGKYKQRTISWEMSIIK